MKEGITLIHFVAGKIGFDFLGFCNENQSSIKLRHMFITVTINQVTREREREN